MSERASRIGAAALLLALSGQARVQAQTTDRLAAPRHAVAVARAQLDRARAQRSADSARRAAQPIVRRYFGAAVHADSSRIAPKVLAAVDSAFILAHTVAWRFLGSVADSAFAGVAANIAAHAAANSELPGGDYRYPELAAPGLSAVATIDAAAPDIQAIADVLIDWFGTVAAASEPPALSRWAPGALPLGETQRESYRVSYRRLALSPSRAARACLDGSLTACRNALALMSDDIGSRTSPTMPLDRSSLLRLALLQGGPQAFSRLRDAQAADPAAILEVTAAVPLDTVLALWRAHLIADRPAPPTPTPSEAVVGVMFAAGFIVAAARRRPR